MKNKKWIIFLVGAIIVLAFFLRIVNIENTPPGVYPDEAVNGEDAVRALETGDFQWFYPANNGREGLFMNIIAFLFKFFGVSVLTLKLPAIICGTLTVWGTYLLARELFQKERLAVIAAFLTAVSFWPLNFSRISFRANMLPLILVFSFYFIFRGLRTKKTTDFIIGGLIFGLGFHTYISFRIAPLILVALLVSLLLTYRGFFREYWKKMIIFAAAAAVSAFPMVYTFFYSHPEYLESRSASISILSPEVNQGNLPATFAKSFGLSLVKYNFWGDQNWRHNFPPYPVLDTIAGIAFLFGFISSFILLFRYFFLRIFRGQRDLKLNVHLLLIGWFFAMLVPEFMTAEGLPHALRSIGTLPVAFIFAAMGFEFAFAESARHGAAFKYAAQTLLVGILIFIGIFNVAKYHFIWANKIETARAFEKVLMNVSREIKNEPEKNSVFVVAETMQRVPLKLFNPDVPPENFIYPREIKEAAAFFPAHPVIYLTERNDEAVSFFRSEFPGLELEEKKDAIGISHYVLK